MKTYQFGVVGSNTTNYSLKVAPMTTEEFVNVPHCFLVNGTDTDPIVPQTVFPDTTGFNVRTTAIVVCCFCDCYFIICNCGYA